MKTFFHENKKNSAGALDRIASACNGLIHISEADAPFTAFAGECTGKLDPSTAATAAETAKKGPVGEITLEGFFENLTCDRDWYGEKEKKNAKRFAELKIVLEEELRDLRVYRFGQIQIDIVVAGLDRDGCITGIKTTAVET